MMGRPRVPTRLAIAAGDPRKIGKRKLQERLKGEPQPERGYPECPAHLTGNARIGWERLTDNLTFLGLDAQVDSLAIQAAATLYGRAMDADVVIAEKGSTMEIPVVANGVVVGHVVKTRPEEAISRRSWALYRQYASDLAATQAARTRLPATAQQDAGEDLATLLSRPREKRDESVQ